MLLYEYYSINLNPILERLQLCVKVQKSMTQSTLAIEILIKGSFFRNISPWLILETHNIIKHSSHSHNTSYLPFLKQ